MKNVMPRFIYAIKVEEDEEDVLIAEEFVENFCECYGGETIGIYELKEVKELSIEKTVDLI